MTLDSAITDSDFRCAAWTRGQNVDPIGSAPRCDTLVLIEVPPPWPRDVGTIPAFADLLSRGLRHTRLLAVRPGATPGVDDAVPVTIWRRGHGGRLAGTDHVVAAAGLADGIADLLDGSPALDPGSRNVVVPEVLICGHGVRDRCCGRLGARLALTVADDWPGVRVRYCSHTGGHRFAPTGITLPDGLAWGYLDADRLDVIVRRTGAPPLHGHYRGSTALDRWAQVVERALFERFGWAWHDQRVTSAHTRPSADGRGAEVELCWSGPGGGATTTGLVEVVRDVPVPVCGQHPDLARKVAPELVLRSMHTTP